jgi:hypothetical protein
MKKLTLALVAVLTVAVASDVAFARGGGGGNHGGGGGSGSGGGHHGGGGYTGGGHAGGHGGAWHGGGYGGGGHGGGHANRWHGGGGYGGWYGAGLGIYLGDLAYWGAWPYPYDGTYPGYYPYPVYTSDAATVYVEPQQQAAPAPTYYWYYCTNPAGYYPYVQNCNDAWMAVAPQR